MRFTHEEQGDSFLTVTELSSPMRHWPLNPHSLRFDWAAVISPSKKKVRIGMFTPQVALEPIAWRLSGISRES